MTEEEKQPAPPIDVRLVNGGRVYGKTGSWVQDTVGIYIEDASHGGKVMSLYIPYNSIMYFTLEFEQQEQEQQLTVFEGKAA